MWFGSRVNANENILLFIHGHDCYRHLRTIMSMPSRPPPRRAPNPFLLLGLAVVGTGAFFYVAEQRKSQPLGRKMAQSLLIPRRDAEVEEPERPTVVAKRVQEEIVDAERRV